MSLPNTLNALPVGAGIELQTAINSGRLIPPNQNFVGPLICLIVAGCAALCEAIEGTLTVCAVCIVIGGVCYTIEQIQNQIKTLQDAIKALYAECGLKQGQDYINCVKRFSVLQAELAKWVRRLAEARGLGSQSTGSSPSNPGGSPSHKPQM